MRRGARPQEAALTRGKRQNNRGGGSSAVCRCEPVWRLFFSPSFYAHAPLTITHCDERGATTAQKKKKTAAAHRMKPGSLALLACSAQLGRSSNCSFIRPEHNPGKGWGGSCTCPDGTVYGSAAIDDECGSLACFGGVSGTCEKRTGPWSDQQVHCSTEPAATPLDPVPSQCVSQVTVAYSFIARNSLPLWSIWQRYFASCPAGSAIPLVHSQDVSTTGRAKLQAQLDQFGGQLLLSGDGVRPAGRK